MNCGNTTFANRMISDGRNVCDVRIVILFERSLIGWESTCVWYIGVESSLVYGRSWCYSHLKIACGNFNCTSIRINHAENKNMNAFSPVIYVDGMSLRHEHHQSLEEFIRSYVRLLIHHMRDLPFIHFFVISILRDDRYPIVSSTWIVDMRSHGRISGWYHKLWNGVPVNTIAYLSVCVSIMHERLCALWRRGSSDTFSHVRSVALTRRYPLLLNRGMFLLHITLTRILRFSIASQLIDQWIFLLLSGIAFNKITLWADCILIIKGWFSLLYLRETSAHWLEPTFPRSTITACRRHQLHLLTQWQVV
jgi:hypothetical protein